MLTHSVLPPIHTTQAAYPKEGIRLDDLSGKQWYEPIEAYGQSKLALLVFMRELDRHIREVCVCVVYVWV